MALSAPVRRRVAVVDRDRRFVDALVPRPEQTAATANRGELSSSKLRREPLVGARA